MATLEKHEFIFPLALPNEMRVFLDYSMGPDSPADL